MINFFFYIVLNYTDMSSPMEMYTVWVTSYFADIFPYRTPLLQSAFSMSKGTVTMETTDATDTGNIALMIFPCM